MEVKQKLEDLLKEKIRLKHYSIRTEKAYVDWYKRFVRFHNLKHPQNMKEYEVEQFLSYLATDRNVSASTQNQAMCAILFLYKEVLGIELGQFKDVIRAKKPERLPVVFTKNEVRKVIANLRETHQIMANLLYGAGLRLMECIRLRVKDIDFEYRQITVREGKGQKDRVTMLPEIVREPLKLHMENVRILHKQDLAEGFGEVYLPYALVIPGTVIPGTPYLIQTYDTTFFV